MTEPLKNNQNEAVGPHTLQHGKYDNVLIDDIVIEEDRFRLGAPVEDLVNSIEVVGLIEPIVLQRRSGELMLVAGSRRLSACRELGWVSIPSIIHEEKGPPGHWHELAEIDENLMRRELSPAERVLLTIKRKSIYEAMHPEARHGATGRKGKKDRNSRSFTANTAASTGRSRGDVARDATRGKQLGPSDLEHIIGTSLDSGAEIDALRKIPVEERGHLISRAAKGEKVTARAIHQPGELMERALHFLFSLKHADEDELTAFMDDELASQIKQRLQPEEPFDVPALNNR